MARPAVESCSEDVIMPKTVILLSLILLSFQIRLYIRNKPLRY